VVTWMLADDVLDTGIRADDGADHAALLDGLMVAHADDSQQAGSGETSSSPSVTGSGAHEGFDGLRGDGPLDGSGDGRE